MRTSKLQLSPLWITLVSSPALGQATGPSPTVAAMQAAERNKTADDMAKLPELPPAPIADVAQLRRDGDRLQIVTALAPAQGQWRIRVTDLDGLFSVNNNVVHRRGAPALAPLPPGGRAVPEFFLFEWFQFDQPGLTDVGTTLQTLPINVQLSRTTETPDGGGMQIQVIEQRYPGAWGDGPPLKFTVSDQGGNGRPPAPDQAWSAESFGALCRLHPGPVARYLEPILRDLHADAAVLTPEPALAYQVFAADVAVDPAAEKKVKALVAQLDADDFHDRDAAGEQLRALGPVAAVVIGRMKVDDLSPEQRARTAAVLRHFRPVDGADADRLRGDADYLLTCLNDTDPFVVRSALGRLREVVGHGVSFDGSLTGQARRDAVWRLRGELTHGGSTRP
jgi:hypothetical protein